MKKLSVYQWLRTRSPGWVVLLLVPAVASGGLWLPRQTAAADVKATGVLVQETFTGATAGDAFHAVGAACLTGAARGADPGEGGHPLGGCPAGATGPVPPDNAAPDGYLRLTDASDDQSAAVLHDQALPSAHGLDVTFEQWQYGGATVPPADGISFFLVDGAASLTRPGAFGGSLGYAQKLPDGHPGGPFLPGAGRGYVGVGLDVLGHFLGDGERRGDGCAVRSPAGTVFRNPAPGPNMITVRGPGNGTEGYCFLAATTGSLATTGPWPSTLPGELHGPTATLPPGSIPEEAETLLEPSRRTVNVHITPAPDPVLTVSVDFNDGNGLQEVLSAPAPEPVPPTYKFGFAASTGQFTDVHLLRNVSVSTVTEPPPLGLVRQVPQDPPLPADLPAGTAVPYEYVVTGNGGTTVTGLAVTDSVVPRITCPRTALAPGGSITCTGTRAVTGADAERCAISTTATATGTSDGTAVTSPTATLTTPACGNEPPEPRPGPTEPCREPGGLCGGRPAPAPRPEPHPEPQARPVADPAS